VGAGAWVAFVTAMGACGARTGLYIPPPAPECYIADDCIGSGDLCAPVVCVLFSEMDDGTGGDTGDDGGAGGTGPDAGGVDAGGVDAGDGGVPRGGVCRKLEPIDCDDNDPCTDEECNRYTGQCVYNLTSFDIDGDGYRGPRVGTIAGQPESCGDDCDDTSELAHPGGIEVCDGVDNDCNGIVDDNADFIPTGQQAIRISGDIDPAGPGGLAWSGTSYAAAYTGTSDGFAVFRTMIDPSGNPIPPGEEPVTIKSADASGGPIVWVGDRYGFAWQDRRDGDYEVYFTVLDQTGAKVFPDTRLSNAFGFSVNVALTWTGAEFVTVWQDERDGFFNLYGQRISVDSQPIGANIAMTSSQGDWNNEGPSVAAGFAGIGVAWTAANVQLKSSIIQFQTFKPDLSPLSTEISLTNGSTVAVYPTVVWNEDRYVIAWYDKSANPQAIYAAAVAEDGTLLVPATPVTSPGSFRSRYPFLRPLGDRLLLVYSDDRDQNDGYELYSRMIGSDLTPVTVESRLTFDKRESVNPIATFGPDGNVGILFRDDRDNGEHHVFFMNLGCVAMTNP
jgi:hypothetical protein